MKVELISYSNLGEKVCGIASKTCVSKNIPDTNDNVMKSLRSAISSGHEAVLEHFTMTFAIEGVSRALLAQLSRHRLMSLNVQSQRYVDMDGFDYVVPESILNHPDSLEQFKWGIKAIQKVYKTLLAYGIDMEDARYILPNAACTNIVVSVNARELRHIAALRMCCFDSETEILTDKGWRLFTDLTGEELYYSLNPESWDCELVPAKEIFAYDYEGDMVHIKSQSVDQLVTPNHKFYCNSSFDKKYDKDKWVLRDAEKVVNWNMCLFKKNCNPIAGNLSATFKLPSITVCRGNQHSKWEVRLDGPTVDTKDWFRFLAFYLSDGCAIKTGHHRIISLAKGDKAILEKYVPIISKLTKNNVKLFWDRHCYNLKFEDEYMYEYLKQFGKAPEKRLPDYVWEYDSSILQSLFEGFIDGDCHKVNLSLSTVSSGMADDYQRLMLHLGYSSTISSIDRRGDARELFSNGKPHTIQSKHIEYRASCNRFKNMPIVKSNKQDPFEIVDYKGTVHCVELERNNIVYIRRNGFTSWSGNSRAQKEIRDLVTKMVELAKEVAPTIFENTGPSCVQAGYCPEGKRSCGRAMTLERMLDIVDEQKTAEGGRH